MTKSYKINGGGIILDVVITQEVIAGKTYFVAQGIQIDVASQGLSLEEALENIKDAADIVLQNSKEIKKNMYHEMQITQPMLTRIFL